MGVGGKGEQILSQLPKQLKRDAQLKGSWLKLGTGKNELMRIE